MIRPLLLSLAFAVAAVAVVACTIGGTPPPDDTKHHETSGEGEGEGEGEGPSTPIDVGAPPQGYTASAPAANLKCSTQQWWNAGDSGTETMHPGGDCIGCHSTNGGPQLAIGGTVMGRHDDGDDCRGIPNVTVDIIAKDGSIALTEQTNDAGNLLASGDLTSIAPYTIKLTYQGRAIAMTTPQTDGNCLHCHTVQGKNGAPGRITAP
jgi:hypothetical protein